MKIEKNCHVCVDEMYKTHLIVIGLHVFMQLS